MPHRHHFIPHEPRAAPVGTTTIVKPVYVTAGYSAPTSAPAVVAPAPQVSHVVGAPVLGSPTSETSHQLPKSTHSYNAPPVRQHRPNSAQSSKTVDGAKNAHAAPSSHRESSIEAPAATHHHQHVGSSIKSAASPSGSLAHNNVPNLAPADHNQHRAPVHKSTQDQGMSGGAKAGLAIGLILAFALIGGLIFLVYRRKKAQNEAHQPLDDEKEDLHKSQASISSHVSVRRTVANAPRLSLRPVTEMFPVMSEKQDNTSASTLIASSAVSARTRTPEANRSLQPSSEDAKNPFGDDAGSPEAGDHNTLATPAAVVPKPLSIKSERTGNGLPDASPPLVDQSSPASGQAPGARRLSPPGPGPNNVHRVQLDFNPSMDDELGLRAGQLVRMLHEYDDGWALCVRLDRSQQGVVPRTCISKLPVKPRPQGPPAAMRGPPQSRPRGGSNAPAPRGPPSDPRQRQGPPPNGRVRSQSSAHHRPQVHSPGPFGAQAGMPSNRPRSNSDALSARRLTPPGTSGSSLAATSPTQGGGLPSRKPVPGQAL